MTESRFSSTGEARRGGPGARRRAPRDASASETAKPAHKTIGSDAAKSPSKKSPKTLAKRAARDGGDKRERILRAATRVFARKGFYATRVSEVAKAAGVADGTIYLYFKSKDALLVSLFEDRIMLLIATLDRELALRATPTDKLRCILELQLGLLEGERDLAEVITVNLRQSTRLMKQYAAPKFALYLDTIAEVIAGGQREGEFRDDVSPHVVARVVFGALDGLTMTWALGKADPGGLTRTAKQVGDVLLRGLSRR